MEFKKEKVGFLEVNCYIIPSEKDGCVYIIDPGASPDKVAESAKSFGMSDYRILLTHGHIDHISGVKELMDLLPVSTFYMHEDELSLYHSPANELQPLMPAISDPPKPVKEISSEDFTVIPTPGHTRGGVCYYFKEDKSLFSGDTLFNGSIGRTDLPGGETQLLLESIKENLFSLPEDVSVYPGHGPSTTIGKEKESNPFF